MLLNGVFVGWVGQLTRWTVNMTAWTDCKPGFFWHEFAAQYSSMLLAVMSIEKLVALYFPFKAKSYCTVGTAKWVTPILALVIVVFNSPICLTSLTRAKCGTRSTLCWKVGNISGSTELFAL